MPLKESAENFRRAIEAFAMSFKLKNRPASALDLLDKDVRDRQRAAPHPDSLEDCIAYAALKAEARLREGGA